MQKDPSIEKKRPLMEAIWKKMTLERDLPAGLSGEYVRYLETDPRFLYETGFIDTTRFTYEEWEKALSDCRQPDGSYLVSKDKFVQLGKFKFIGHVKKPLDAMNIKEGWYTLRDWHEFCVKCILPSTTISLDQLNQSEMKMQEDGHIKNGKVLVDKPLKLKIKSVLDHYPSPTRRRELAVADALEHMEVEEAQRHHSSPNPSHN